MQAVLVIFVPFLITTLAGARSLAQGLLVLFSVGYAFGIVRSNSPSVASTFIFDASLFGLYLSQKWKGVRSEGQSTGDIQTWAIALMAWPLLMACFPLQTPWVTLAGLRGSILFLPLMLLGTRLKNGDLQTLAKGLAILNLIALGFAVAEYFRGIEPFFPKNEVTLLIYASKDVAGGNFRIPSIFSNAHNYGGVMLMSIPFLFGAWTQRDQSLAWRPILMLGMLAAFFGILLSATRLNFILGAVLLLVATTTRGVSIGKRLGWIAALLIVGALVLQDERLQRFSSLQDTDLVSDRVEGSVNNGFWDIFLRYPFGNGLGGGGTSLPYFLQDQVRDPVLMENEYARILAEQGAIGLFFWAAFIGWHLQNRLAFQKTAWLSGRRLAWFACTGCFATGLIGTGLLTAIPQSAMILLCMGWISASPSPDRQAIPRSTSFVLQKGIELAQSAVTPSLHKCSRVRGF